MSSNTIGEQGDRPSAGLPMTAPSPAGLSPLLDQLDEARAKGTPGLWAQQNGAPNLVYGDPDVGMFVCNTGYDHVGSAADSLPAADAALIVAEHNAVPLLVAAVRGVLERHRPEMASRPGGGLVCTYCSDPYTSGALVPYPCDEVSALTAALTPGADTAGATA